MINSQQINQWVQNIIETLPPGLIRFPEDLKEHLKLALQQAFEKMELVSRDDYDTQVKVLLKTRKKVEELEKRITELEQKVN